MDCGALIIDYAFACGDVAQYARWQLTEGRTQVDAQTWDELQLDAYPDRVRQGCSIFGRQALYRGQE
jgi:hypothetical protein